MSYAFDSIGNHPRIEWYRVMKDALTDELLVTITHAERTVHLSFDGQTSYQEVLRITWAKKRELIKIEDIARVLVGKEPAGFGYKTF